MLQDYIYEYIHSYIENEIDYIKADETCNGLDDSDINDLYMLNHITENEKMEIAEKIVDDNKIGEQIDELIHYHLYH